MPKRIMAILLCLAAAVSGLAGCGHKTEITGKPDDTAINSEQTEAEERVSGGDLYHIKRKVLRGTAQSCGAFFV